MEAHKQDLCRTLSDVSITHFLDNVKEKLQICIIERQQSRDCLFVVMFLSRLRANRFLAVFDVHTSVLFPLSNQATGTFNIL